MNLMSQTFTLEFAGRTLKATVGKFAEQASGAVMMNYGNTTVMSTATASSQPREGIDFFPLSVDYEEKFYSIGKIPGGFIKREGRPSENAILTSRVIDRPIRPLFPKDYRNDCAVVNTVMSVDQDCSPEFTAMIGTSIALSISDIPFYGPVGSCIVGLVDGEIVINPTLEQKAKNDLQMTVSSTSEKIMMIEAGANVVPDDVVVDAIFKGHEENQKLVAWINEIVAAVGKEKHSYESSDVPKEVYDKVVAFIGQERMETAVFTDVKQEREERMDALKAEVKAHFEELEDEEVLANLGDAIYKFEKLTVRKMILKDQKRPDGRKLNEIRTLTSEVDIVPTVHGSGLFSRGQTQVLTLTTLGAVSESQTIDGLDESVTEKRYMHHYNFPSYSVGETRPSRGPGRREIGHGALAERALLPVIPSADEFPYAIRLVSEILSSNGSTSQGSICASTLSLMAAGVPIKAPVAGISVGLVTGESGDDDDYIILTDIQGLEDFFGDMDFKVAGTHEGITAIQMDMKIKGLTKKIVREAIERTKEARMTILDDAMLKAIPEPRKNLAETAPKIYVTKIDPEKISAVIGPRGKTINKIIDETGVKIDINDDGDVFVCGLDEEMANKAIKIIETVGKDVKVGELYDAKVVRLAKFGAFVELAPGKEALLHISKISHEHIKNVEDVLSVDDMILVKVTEIDGQGRLKVSRKDAMPDPKAAE